MSNEVFKDASKMSGGRASDDAIIVIEGVFKRFKDFEALKNINMQVGRKEVVVVIGPSGSGKSTLIRCINRLEAHDDGHILVDGTALTTDIRNIQEIRKETGMVFQNFNLFPPSHRPDKRCNRPQKSSRSIQICFRGACYGTADEG